MAPCLGWLAPGVATADSISVDVLRLISGGGMLEDMFAEIQKGMRNKLEELRSTFKQSGDKGSSVEKVVRDFLRNYLPRRLEIGTGEIIDSKGHRSGQTDIVIVNEDHPFTFTNNSPSLFFIEGVSAAGEAKTLLTSEELDRALNASFSFKQLEVNPGIATICSNPSDRDRFYKCPPYFLFAFESQLELSTVLTKIEDFLKTKGAGKNDTNKVVDAIFIMNQGWLMNFGDGQGFLQYITAEGKPAEGWDMKKCDTVLFHLMGWLSVVMPRAIRYTPILPSYIFPNRNV